MKEETKKVATGTTFTFGNFKVALELDSEIVKTGPEKLFPWLLSGCTQELQRKPASKLEKEFAGYDKRPLKFERDSIAFSAERASAIEVEFGAVVDGIATVAVSEHVAGEASEPTYKAEKQIVAGKAGDEDRLEALAKAVGYEGDGLTSENLEFLKAIREYLREQERKAKAAVAGL